MALSYWCTRLCKPSFLGIAHLIPTDEQTFPKAKRTSGAKDFANGSLNVLPKTDPDELFDKDGKSQISSDQVKPFTVQEPEKRQDKLDCAKLQRDGKMK